MINKQKHTIVPLLASSLPAVLSTINVGQALAQDHSKQRYNIVYIMTDDHTAQMMSCYDKRYVETPNLDRIAKDGVRFTHSYVANSLSGPSRACMFTGKHSHKNGFTHNEHGIFDGSQQTMPKLLQKAGYQTAVIGKWHLVSLPTGFDYWNILPEQGSYYNPDFITMQNDTVREKGYLTNIVTDKSIDWLDNKRDKSKPFILFVHHKACHRNWLPELKYLNEYEDKTFSIPENFYDNYAGRKAAAAQEMEINKDMDLIYDTKMYLPGMKTSLSATHLGMLNRLNPEERKQYDALYDRLSKDFYDKKLSGKELAEFKYQRYMRDYAKVLKSLDDNVGRMLDHLRDQGLLDNTLVVYTSDQGFYMGEHGWFDKRFMYEESFGTPLVMMLPKGLERRGDVNELVQNIDYAPTFLDLAGVEVPQDIQGRSLLPLLKQNKKVKNWRKSLYYHFYEYPAEHRVKRHYGVRNERYKLIHFYRDIDEWELYDLKKDPKEMNNIYGKPGTEKITQKMRDELWQLQQQYDDPIRFTYPLSDKK